MKLRNSSSTKSLSLSRTPHHSFLCNSRTTHLYVTHKPQQSPSPIITWFQPPRVSTSQTPISNLTISYVSTPSTAGPSSTASRGTPTARPSPSQTPIHEIFFPYAAKCRYLCTLCTRLRHNAKCRLFGGIFFKERLAWSVRKCNGEEGNFSCSCWRRGKGHGLLAFHNFHNNLWLGRSGTCGGID